MAQVDWMSTGQEFVAQAGGQAAVLAEVERLTWHTLPCSAPMMQGYAIGRLIADFVKGHATEIAYDGILCDRYDLIGIRAEYANGTYRHYFVDTGTVLVSLLTAQEEQ